MSNRIENEIAHGKKISENAEDVWGWATPAGQIRANRRAGYFISEGLIKQGDKVLEIGCGTGLFTEKVFNETKAEIIATDLSEDLLEVARKKGLPITFKAEDAMRLSFDNESFDVVFGSSILHHLDFEKSLNEIYRVLKPGGRLVFAEPNMINPQILVQKNVGFIKEWLGDSPDETAIVRWSFSKLLRKHNFKKVNIFPYDFLHPYTPKPLIGLVNRLGKLFEKLPLTKEIAGSVIISAHKPK
jgi:ubiquinone/menaquinone biosynthesis C-methylase UbiE